MWMVTELELEREMGAAECSSRRPGRGPGRGAPREHDNRDTTHTWGKVIEITRGTRTSIEL